MFDLPDENSNPISICETLRNLDSLYKEIQGEDLKGAIKKLLKLSNLTSTELLGICGMDKKTLSRIYTGNSLTLSNLVSICLAMHLPPSITLHVLSLAGWYVVPNSPCKTIRIYFTIIFDYWATDYDDLYRMLAAEGLENYIHYPA